MLSTLKTAAVAGTITLSALLAVPVACVIVMAATTAGDDGARSSGAFVGYGRSPCMLQISTACLLRAPDQRPAR